eukprot:scaffold407_cov251-Pinguiococcus_pyrenoidosus.AAC.16
MFGLGVSVKAPVSPGFASLCDNARGSSRTSQSSDPMTTTERTRGRPLKMRGNCELKTCST